jgi:hypothetical protein
MMLQAADLMLPPEEFEWREYTVRLLTPKGWPWPAGLSMSEAFTDAVAASETQDVLASTPLGTGVACRCGAVAINTDGYPWGRERYKRDVHCPHCDGGEDVG